MIYFDNAATTLPKPPEVVQAVTQSLTTFGNPSRGSYDASLEALRCMLRARVAISDLFNVGNPMNVAFSHNATAALNIAVSSIDGHIVTTAAEHNSVLRPLYRRGNFTVVELDRLGRLDLSELEKAIRPNTEAIVMCHASNLTGNVFDIESVGQICRKHKLKFVLDAAQTAGLLPIDMVRCGISALCFSGHKSLYGTQGTGGICVGEGFVPRAVVVGGSGSESFSQKHPVVMPDALEAGTQNAHGIAGLLAGVNYVVSMDGKVFSEASEHAKKFVREMKKLEGVTLYGDVDAKVRTPVVSLNIRGIGSADLAAELFERFGIAVRAGAHCAPLMHKSLGTSQTGAVRFSFSHFNDEHEISFAINCIKDICLRGGQT